MCFLNRFKAMITNKENLAEYFFRCGRIKKNNRAIDAKRLTQLTWKKLFALFYFRYCRFIKNKTPWLSEYYIFLFFYF